MDDATSRIVRRFSLVVLLIAAAAIMAPVGAAGFQGDAWQSNGGSVLLAGGGQARNVILMIGDGMGANQVAAARWEKAGHDPAAYRSTTLAMDGLTYLGTVSTASANSAITDSAAAATALMTGTRTDNGVIGQDATAVKGVSDGAWLETIAEKADAAGLSTGAVTTVRITHATPAGVYAHVNSRDNELLIASQFIDADLEVALGGGYSYFLPSTTADPWGVGGVRTDGRDLVAEAKAQGYTVATTASGLAAAPAVPGTKVLGLFSSQYMAYETVRTSTTQPSLAAMTSEALELLSTDPDGFVLMVEGGQIDTAAHANNYARMTGEVLAFDAAVATARAFADAHPGTLVIVTADHETGGLAMRTNGDGTLSFSFTSTGHTAANVPLRASGPGADGFGTTTVPNTRVFEVMRDALGLGTVAPTPSPTATPSPTPSSTQTASIKFTSTPPGAQIVIDGVSKGVTPATVPGIALGTHMVRLQLPGYQTWTKTIQVTSAFLTTVYSYNPPLVPIAPAVTATPTPGATLSGQTASIKFTSIPAGGKIYLDGVYRGATPTTIPGITLGVHRAEIRYTGYVPWVKSITVTSDFVLRTFSYNPTLVRA